MSAYKQANKIVHIKSFDVRFPTSLTGDGSDAIHEPDYSCVYVILETESQLYTGHGLTFTVGRGNEIVKLAVDSLSRIAIGWNLTELFSNFSNYWRKLTNDTQLRWLGPEKGVIHLATAAISNAIFDLWAKIEGKPVWKLLVDMTPEQLVSTIDFTYISDCLTRQEALDILRCGQNGKECREENIKEIGYPAYTTSAGWLNYDDKKITDLCNQALKEGFTRFKIKVGKNPTEDSHRLGLVRSLIGQENLLMLDANQKWNVPESISHMKQLSAHKPFWIEEPTSPDDILGHRQISKQLNPLGIKVAGGEHCQNRIMFKQFLQSDAIQICQIDSCRLGGPNEIISVLLMAHKFKVPVCPHAGGVGLCELVQHYSIFDYVCISQTTDNRMIEYVDHLHHHFQHPVQIRNGTYTIPEHIGFSSSIKPETLRDYSYPNGKIWQKLFADGVYKN